MILRAKVCDVCQRRVELPYDHSTVLWYKYSVTDPSEYVKEIGDVCDACDTEIKVTITQLRDAAAKAEEKRVQALREIPF